MAGKKALVEILSDILEIYEINHTKNNEKITIKKKPEIEVEISEDIVNYRDLKKTYSENTDKLLVISMEGFTEGAVELSKINEITLWDRKKLQREIGKAVLTELDFKSQLDLNTPENLEIAEPINTTQKEKSGLLDIIGSKRENQNTEKKHTPADNGSSPTKQTKPKQKTTKNKKQTDREKTDRQRKKPRTNKKTDKTEDKKETKERNKETPEKKEQTAEETEIPKYCLDARVHKKEALKKSGMATPIEAKITLEPIYKFTYKVENSEYLDEIETSQQKTIYVDGETGEMSNLPRESKFGKRPVHKEEEKKYTPNVPPNEAEEIAISHIKKEMVKRARYGGIRYSTTKKFHSDFDEKDQFNINIKEKTLIYRPIWSVETKKGEYKVDATDGKVISGTIDDGVMFL